jgi:hypothetical protein
MAIEQEVVAEILSAAFPEFGSEIAEHRKGWGNDPMLYLLVGALFRFVDELAPGRERVLRAQRVYALTDRMLSEGSPSVRDCFSIEMIEPLTAMTSSERYPSLEAALGPAGKNELAKMREWWRRHGKDMATHAKSRRCPK